MGTTKHGSMLQGSAHAERPPETWPSGRPWARRRAAGSACHSSPCRARAQARVAPAAARLAPARPPRISARFSCAVGSALV